MKIIDNIRNWWNDLSFEAEQIIATLVGAVTGIAFSVLMLRVYYKCMRKAVRSELGEMFGIRGFFKKK